jgi:hypothetical protein
MTDDTGRSAEACPACGAHRLALLDFPSTPVAGYQAYAEIIGIVELQPEQRPAIGCLACGEEWPDLGSFRQAAGEASP